jgi:hypothetical protein
MPRPGFYNDNINRDYPFVDPTEGTDDVPDCAIADVGITMLGETMFVEGTHSVYLDSISRTGTTFTFTFSSDATGLTDDTITLTRETTDDDYVTGFASGATEHLQASCSESTPECIELCDGELWEMFLVSGSMDTLAGLLGDGVTFTGPWRIEPSLTQNLHGATVRSLSIANADRTRSETPEECKDYCLPFTPKEYYVQCQCLTGDALFQDGFNLTVRFSSAAGEIVLDAAVGGGAGEACGSVLLDDAEVPPTNRLTVDGGLSCDEVVKSINGVSRQFFYITGGGGVVVTPSPSLNKIIVNANLADLALCADLPLESSLSDPASADGECDCGSL